MLCNMICKCQIWGGTLQLCCDCVIHSLNLSLNSGTWFGEIPVRCCLTGSAWLCLDISPNIVPEAVRITGIG